MPQCQYLVACTKNKCQGLVRCTNSAHKSGYCCEHEGAYGDGAPLVVTPRYNDPKNNWMIPQVGPRRTNSKGESSGLTTNWLGLQTDTF